MSPQDKLLDLAMALREAQAAAIAEVDRRMGRE